MSIDQLFPRYLTLCRAARAWCCAVTLVFLFIGSHAQASDYQLAPNQWESLVIPANPDGGTVADLLGDDMDPLVFGTDWIVYLFDGTTQSYTTPASEDMVLQEGHAFWIIQVSNEAVTLNMPVDLPASELVQSSSCASPAGCAQLDLPTTGNGAAATKYDLLGSPFPFATEIENWRITTDSTAANCGEGCSLEQASPEFTQTAVWVWDNSINDYARPASGETLAPWQGFWMAATPALQALSPVLEIPAEQSTINIRVTTPDGAAVENASVVANNAGLNIVKLTDSEGKASFDLTADTLSVLSVESDFTSPQTKRLLSPATGESITLEITVLPNDYDEDFAPDEDIDVLAGGAGVSIPAGGFVDESGSRYTGGVRVIVTSVDVADIDELAGFPGDFSGIPDSGPQSPIISLGTTNFEFVADNGESLQLAADVQADIHIPIFSESYQDGTSINIGDEIPLWFLNEDTGIWEQEGVGTVVANPDTDADTPLALSATVDHFSWWNCDVTMNAVRVRIQVAGPGAGVAVITGTTNANLGWRPNTVQTVVNIGQTTSPLFVPNGAQVCYSADVTFSNGATSSSDTVCAAYTSDPASPIVLTVPDVSEPFAFEPSATLVQGSPGLPIQRIRLAPTSVESDVTYVDINNALPDGLSITKINATYSEIAGYVDIGVSGSISVDIQGTAADGETATREVTFDISEDTPPPQMIGGTALINGDFEQNFWDFNTGDFDSGPRNIGAPASSWSVQPALPPGMVLLPFGVIEIPYELLFNSDPSVWDWSGTVTATNPGGSSSAQVTIEVICEFCGGFDVQDVE